MSKTTSDKSVVQLLVQQCIKKGIREVVISPGSRNAPLIIAFNAIENIECFTIVDERSAAFVALGMAQQLRRPVAIICTSGTAALNYAPAIAEAYYQEIPLVVLTADRPKEWVGQADGQTIDQSNIFSNYIKHSIDLPVKIAHDDDAWYANRSISEALNNTMHPVPAPVHINIPLREPLYGRTAAEKRVSRPIEQLIPEQTLSVDQIQELATKWNKAESVMIVAGVLAPCEKMSQVLSHLGQLSNTVFLTETTTNQFCNNFITCIDRQMFSIDEDEAALFKPSLLISLGGQIVSKKIKEFLRNNPPKEHWHISQSDKVIDTFQRLSLTVKMDAYEFFSQVASHLKVETGRFKDIWQKRSLKNQALHEQFIEQTKWSDLKALNHIFTHLPEESQLQLANSTPVRYAQLFQNDIKVHSFANRGTSGIDGSVSTAVGASINSENPTILITGDLSFMYDSNGLWNSYLKKNFKVIVINNGGGGIFRFIPGPSDSPELEQFFEAKHQYKAEHLAYTYGLDYFSASSLEELEDTYNNFVNNNTKASLLEVFTPGDINGKILRNYFKNFSNNR
ncbi:2-succinyl-5-enolpyruvyl-6-hydroxy-3-cyclohexene-1-carboxylic-acid synthase [Saccharicrinis aurantiacus]|uniref:2-succinyl-5-enolpyruvyl-6-hydroxy-3- cyclohexene-1-carboxylic-acid synthase n=1 Tax=Saccharicrinis aurantiacus TaxID=1849719 RepID=UPI0024910574|nr:2-succinyl-5-enolpyruvyl-6-hydroxy-3-cyclohexene-1-carboxylic-acid synthase [Saccharicrinis aurantiacus]